MICISALPLQDRFPLDRRSFMGFIGPNKRLADRNPQFLKGRLSIMGFFDAARIYLCE
jgi:hypothetical protein